MLKVLIADDEVKVCKLILHLVDWEKIGLEVIGTVNDGKSAYQFICEKKPDIVITDIRMPNYDGIELIRKVKEQYPDIYFIIISGYSHFEYAHNAIKYGVEDYLLKPLKKKELEDTLIKIVEKYTSKMNLITEKEKLESFVHDNKEKVRKNLLVEMLVNPDRVKKFIENQTVNQEYHCNFVEGFFAAIKIQPFFSADINNEATLSLFLSKLDHIVNERLKLHCEELVTSIHHNSVLCIINAKNDSSMSEIKKQLNKMKNDILSLRDIFQEVKIIIGFGGVVDDLSGLFESLKQADISILNRIGEPKKYIIDYKNTDSNVTAKDLIDLKFRNNLLACIERFDIEGVMDKIQILQNKLKPLSYDGKLVYNCYVEIADIFLFGIKNFNIKSDMLDIDWFKKKYNKYLTLESVFLGLQQDFCQIFHKHAENQKSAYNKQMLIAKQYINKNYNTPLSLEDVSSLVGFNPAYFSFLFKKETGKNFMKYVIEVRMQNAKQLLIQTNNDIADIAMEVGYTDLKYFSKLFKKETGLNPSQYRKLYG